MRVLVTGGGGFLGKSICKELLAKGYLVGSFSRTYYPELTHMGVTSHIGDLVDQTAITCALQEGAYDAVIHSAALAGFWGDWALYYQTNVVGTQTLVQAMKAQGVRFLVYTSSPSVAIPRAGAQGTDESIPLPPMGDYLTAYPKSKRLAEEFVLGQALAGDGLRAVALRPHFIWGPQDPHFLPRLKERAHKGRLTIIGTGTNLVDVTYVDNAAWAHRQALEALQCEDSPLNGKAYFIGQESPVNLWDFLNRMLEAVGAPKATFKVPFKLMYGLGWALEVLCRRCHLTEPPMTRFIAHMMSYPSYFSHKQAVQDFQYHPQISTDEGLALLRQAHDLPIPKGNI